MTPTEAAALALLGVHDRRLLAALVRTLTGHATVDDLESLPVRENAEPLVHWACRCHTAKNKPGSPTQKDGPSAPTPYVTRLECEASTQLSRAARIGVTPIPLGDAGYPALLAAIPDPPPLLWLKGDVAALHQPAIAIVGSRAATPYGLSMAKRLAVDLSAAGFVIVSGLARGIDSAAHVAALSARGQTIGVLGCGIDRIYPSEHRDLARDMEQAGAVISEYPSGVPPLQHHFPLRNRLISGLSTAVVVVEAPEKSGALITASAAAEHGREVMVVPGPATGGRNRGGHLLIRDGAKLVESADDILQEVGLVAATRSFAAAERELRQLPESADFTVDEVAERTGEEPSAVLARLLDLELAGRIQRIGGGRFVRVLT